MIRIPFRRELTGLTFAFLLIFSPVRAEDPPPVRLTVVVVMATSKNEKVHPKLTGLAQELQKNKDTEKLTGYRIEVTHQESVPVGKSHTFKLVEDHTLKVTVESPKDKTGRIAVTLEASGVKGEMKYACVCDKFVPVVTPHVNKEGEQLIIAVLAKPCTGK